MAPGCLDFDLYTCIMCAMPHASHTNMLLQHSTAICPHTAVMMYTVSCMYVCAGTAGLANDRSTKMFTIHTAINI